MFLECYIIKGRVNGRVVIALAQQSFQDKSPQLLTFVVVVTPIGHDRKEYKKGLSGFCLTQATAPRD